MNKQINDFQSYIYSENFDIIAITETWLSNHTFTNEIFPCSYNVIRKDRDSRGGGVLLALNKSLKIIQLPSPVDLEIVCVEVDSSLFICLIYRPPNSTEQYNSSLLTFLKSLDYNKNLVVLGDLNFPDIDWNTYCGSSVVADEFAEVAYFLNLTQHISGPTHCAGNTLDIVLSNIDSLQHTNTYTVLPFNLSSDHYMLTVCFEQVLSKPTKTHRQRYNYSNVNWEEMNHFLSQYDFTVALNSNNTEFIWFYLKTALNAAIDLYVPRISIKESNQPKWFNSEIRHKIKCLRTSKRQLKRQPSERKRLIVTNLQTKLQLTISKAKSDFESNLALNYAHSNNNKIFQYISSIKGREHFPAKMCYNDEFASTDLQKAQMFNNYFHSVFSASTGPPSIPEIQPSDHIAIQDIRFSDTDVLYLLTSLDTSKACGIDNLSPKIFKFCALPLLQVICHLFQTSISFSNIPLDWRTHRVIPVYKSGNKCLVSNYRPISLLCILSKVLERIVYNNLIDYVRQRSSKHQFGFLPKRSTLQQLLTFAEKVLEPKCEIDVIYMDFKKAFDSVCHNHLLDKLKALGICGKAWKWLEGYLKYRYQCVKIGDSQSEQCNVLSGVPQGSVLGPLLFVIFINDLPLCFQFSTPFVFADDTKCLQVIRSAEDPRKLQSDVNNASVWSTTLNLLFNELKFIHLRFFSKTTSSNYPVYTVNGNPIKNTQHHKDLGITFSSDFTWTAHYKIIISKAYQMLGLIRRTFKIDCVNAKKQLYIALVRSQFQYCSTLWRPQLIKDITMIERIQRRATKYILNDYNSSYKSRLQQLNLLPLMYNFELQDLLFLIKSLKSPTDNFNIHDYITFARGSTRSGLHQKLNHSRSQTAIQHHFYFNRIVRLYNSFPIIDLSLPLNTIKRRIINHLWTHFIHHFNPERTCSLHFLCPCHRCCKEPISVDFNHL